MVSTAEIMKLFSLNRQFLYTQVQQGTFVHGVHYIIISSPNTRKTAYRWNPEAIWQLWATDPAKRASLSLY